MLWVQYQAPQKLEYSFLKQTVENLAALVPGHPVALFDDGPSEQGLIFHNGVSSVDEGTGSDLDSQSDGQLDDHNLFGYDVPPTSSKGESVSVSQTTTLGFAPVSFNPPSDASPSDSEQSGSISGSHKLLRFLLIVQSTFGNLKSGTQCR